jgi:hypothetical protein
VGGGGRLHRSPCTVAAFVCERQCRCGLRDDRVSWSAPLVPHLSFFPATGSHQCAQCVVAEDLSILPVCASDIRISESGRVCGVFSSACPRSASVFKILRDSDSLSYSVIRRLLLLLFCPYWGKGARLPSGGGGCPISPERRASNSWKGLYGLS